MDTNLRSEKQKRPSSSKFDPFSGIFTRSKSQIYIHSNRSGRARSDTTRKRPHHVILRSSSIAESDEPRSKKEKRQDIELNDNISTRVSVKDLRARRVFSPASVGDNECRLNGGIIDLGINEINNTSCTGLKSDFDDTIDLGFCGILDLKSVESNFNDVIPDLCHTREENGVCDLERSHRDGIEDLKLNEERIELTPSDGGIAAGLKLDETKKIEQANDGDISKGSDCRNDKPSFDLRDSIPRNKWVVNSCARRKVFKVPGSFSYRRLLPFLKDMTRDNTRSFSGPSCVSKAEKFGSGVSCNVQSSVGTKPKFSFALSNYNFKNEDNGVSSDGLKSFEIREIKKKGSVFSCEGQNLDQLNLSGKEGCTQLHNRNKKSDENGGSSNGVNESSEEHGVPKIEEIGLKVSPHAQNSISEELKFSSGMDNFSCPEGGNDSLRSATFLSLENGEFKNFGTELSCKAPNLDQLNLHGTEGGTQLHNRNQKSKENGGSSNAFDEPAEEHIQTTPPDMDVLCKPEINMVEKQDNDLQYHIYGNLRKKNATGNYSFACESKCQDISGKNGSVFKSRSILNPCSRRKVFRAPSSFSYRRLLPYLMDISNDKPHNSPVSPKVNNDSEEKKQNTHLLALNSDSQHTPMVKSEAGYSNKEHHTGDTEPDPPTAIPISNDNNKLTLTSAEKCVEPTEEDDTSYKNLTLTFAEKIIEPKEPLDSQNKSMPSTHLVISNNLESSDLASCGANTKHEMTSPAMLLCSPDNSGTCCRDDASKLSYCVSVSSQGDCSTFQKEHFKDINTIHSVCLDEKSSQIEEFISAAIPVDLAKGILRKNPRGCRGLCNCLNCASFRLHADRAFEFSKNQMQDAEELALDLIKNLSYLRDLLEKSTIDTCVHGSVHVDQVKDACTKALKAEELAKCRLHQMNCDLNVHCRSMVLERPRVRFANHVKKLVIPEADLLADSRKE